jgi:hypothetical protein
MLPVVVVVVVVPLLALPCFGAVLVNGEVGLPGEASLVDGVFPLPLVEVA